MDPQELTAATAHLDPPLLALDLAALDANAEALVRRAGGRPIRVASKSVRCRWVLEHVLAKVGFHGVMAYSLREAIWLARQGFDDILVGYPTVDRAALAELGRDEHLQRSITLMIDDAAQLGFAPRGPLRVCIDVDASLRVGPLHLGVRRSPLRAPDDVARLANRAAQQGRRVVGLMFYEAQIAGLPDTSPAVRAVKRRSADELARRRTEVVVEVEKGVGALEIVNSGGTGSLEISAADPSVTEVTAGSGLYAPTLFDHYRAFTPTPALFFALPVVRRPARGFVTLFGGGYIASGPAGDSRVPMPLGAKLVKAEGAGEVQTPVQAEKSIGDRVWFRHAKAGEVCERFDTVHVLAAGSSEDVPTYRGEGKTFG